jgi:hypothetical protein
MQFKALQQRTARIACEYVEIAENGGARVDRESGVVTMSLSLFFACLFFFFFLLFCESASSFFPSFFHVCAVHHFSFFILSPLPLPAYNHDQHKIVDEVGCMGW